MPLPGAQPDFTQYIVPLLCQGNKRLSVIARGIPKPSSNPWRRLEETGTLEKAVNTVPGRAQGSSSPPALLCPTAAAVLEASKHPRAAYTTEEEHAAPHTA